MIVNRVLVLMALAGLAGCAGTRHAAGMPEVPAGGAASAQVSAEAPAVPQAAGALPSIVVQPGIAGPHQCMLAWAQGMQDALQPWMYAMRGCDARTVAP